jgi:hypothetical protein
VRVLFGGRTGCLEGSSREATVQSTNAFHLIVEHFDPSTRLEIWRTYFLESNIKNNWDVRII